jgi:hypothetical protein
MMTKILVYGYCVGVFSSRRIQKRLVGDIAFLPPVPGERRTLWLSVIAYIKDL